MLLSDLTTAVRQLTGTTNSQVVTDIELRARVNESISALYDEVIGIYEHYFVTPFPFTITSGNTTPLPADFYKDNGLDFNPGANALTVHRLGAFLDRNRRDVRGYNITGQTLAVYPAQNAAGSYQLYYTPAPPALVTPTATRTYNTGGSGSYTAATRTYNVSGGGLPPSFTATDVGGAISIGDNGGNSAMNGIFTIATVVSNIAVTLTAGPSVNAVSLDAGGSIYSAPGAVSTNAFMLLPQALLPWSEYIQLRTVLSVFNKRQMDPGQFAQAFALEQARVRKMVGNRTEEPGQIPLTRGPYGRSGGFWYEDLPQ